MLDVIELFEYAWHDWYGEVMPESVIDDILFVSNGEIGKLIRAAKLALEDRRDLMEAVDALRESPDSEV